MIFPEVPEAIEKKLDGKIELSIKVPRLSAENAYIIMRDVRRTLRNCAKLGLLENYAMSWEVER